MRASAFPFALLLLASAALAAPPRFAAPFLSYPAGFDARSVTAADVSGDGHADVLVSHLGGLDVHLGAGDGTIGAAIANGGNPSRFVLTGDLDGNGRRDVVLAHDSLHVAVRMGNGDGTFQAPVPFSVAKGPAGAVLVDLNGDGDLDLVCTAETAHAVSILLGDGSGGFGGPTNVPLGSLPGAIAAGDLDHDGDLDMVVADRGVSGVHRLLGDGAGNLALAGTTTVVGLPGRLALADLNGDTWLDAVVGLVYGPEFFLLPGVAGGTFGTPLPQEGPNTISDLVVADFDADAHPDLALLDHGMNRGELRRGLGGFAFELARQFTTARNPLGIAGVDLNGGGKPDLVTICPYGALSVHMGNGDGTFGGVQDLVTGSYPWAIASGDLDADGHADLVTTNTGNSLLAVHFGAGAGAFTAPLTLVTGTEPHGVTIADADADGHLDIVVAEHGPGTQTSSIVAVHRGDGARGFAAREPHTVGRWAEEVAVGDLTGDGLPELAVTCHDAGTTLTILQNLENAQWGNRQDFTLGSNTVGVAIGDVTRDGKPDVVAAAYYSNTVHVLPGNANGTYGSPAALAVIGAADVAIGDVAGDAAPDLVVSGSAGISVFASQPGGGFAPRVDHPGTALGITAADLDADGRIDVAAATNWPANAVNVWFGQPGGGLGAPLAYGAGDRPFAVVPADVDEDGTLDLATANLEANSISLLLNTGGVAWLPWLGVPPALHGSGFARRVSPNPAHGPGAIRYQLPRDANVRLRLLDVAGRQLIEFERGSRPLGPHRLDWSARGLPAGVAFLELNVDGEREVRRVVLLP
jgi:hypothetical protein